jgi:hypothetical protein
MLVLGDSTFRFGSDRGCRFGFGAACSLFGAARSVFDATGPRGASASGSGCRSA